jgi:mono/diheme cytochrome c family protein
VKILKVSLYFLLMLGGLLAFAFHAGAASNDPATIEFKRGDKVVKVLSLEAMRGIAPAVSLKIFEPHENRERIYQALPARPVLDHVFGKEWEQAREIVFTSIDGFQPSIPVKKFLAHSAYFAFASPDNAPFTTTNPVQNNEVVQLGPLYLVWDNLNSKELLASGDSDFPYQVMRITVTSDAPFPNILPPANASEEVKRGYTHFRQYCVSCHTINGEGGGKAPELNYPASVVEYIKPEYLRRWILSPQSIRYNARMPGLPRGIPNAEQVTGELVSYLKVMSIMKREPAQP